MEGDKMTTPERSSLLIAIEDAKEYLPKAVVKQKVVKEEKENYPKAVFKVDKPESDLVDDWTPGINDKVFKHTKGAIIAPLSELYNEPPDSPLNLFIVSAKRCYNNDPTREHFVKYLNYFEKFYDYDRELVFVYSRIKICMDYYTEKYNKTQLISDLRRYIFSGTIRTKVRYMNQDNYRIYL